MQAISRERAREIDRWAQEHLGLPGDLLMENAGSRASCHVLSLAKERSIEHAVILCGTGNNGGDGFVIARHLADELQMSVNLLGPREKVSGDAEKNLFRLEATGSPVNIGLSCEAIRAILEGKPSIVVDAIFGTGLDRPIAGGKREVIETVNRSGAPVVSIDLPSGLDANTGEVLGVAIHATTTVTFVAPKSGFFTGEGPTLCGDVLIEPIGFPIQMVNFDEQARS